MAIILTDLSEVLIRGIDGMEYILADHLHNSLYVEKKLELTRRFMRRRIEVNHAFREMLRGDLPEDAYWQVFFNKHGDINLLSVPEEAKAAFTENMKLTMPGTLQLYQRIIQHPRRIGKTAVGCVEGRPDIYITSDHIRERLPELHQNHPDVFQIMKGEFWSCEMGCIKSDPEFFPRVIKELGVKPDELIFIDDQLGNVEAARRVGITGIQFKSYDQLEMVLSRIYGFVFAPEAPVSETP